VELEYKRDARTGEMKLLDVNARTWGYHTLGEAAGVDFPSLLFQDMLGHAVGPCRTRHGVKWIRLATDLPTAALQIARGQLGLAAYARSVAHSQVEAVFVTDDIKPGLAEVLLIPYLAVRRGF
jgi:predicted ATP-grasp superfamily ATP-dependent carboligase